MIGLPDNKDRDDSQYLVLQLKSVSTMSNFAYYKSKVVSDANNQERVKHSWGSGGKVGHHASRRRQLPVVVGQSGRRIV